VSDDADLHRANARHAKDRADRARERSARESAAAEAHGVRGLPGGSDGREAAHRRAAELHRTSQSIHEQAADLFELHAIHEDRLAGQLVERGVHGLAGRTQEIGLRERLADEREILAGRRERAADERDRRADERERLADERDRRADERERLADERERLADERDAQFYADTGLHAGWIERRRMGLTRTRSAIRRSEERTTRTEQALDRAEARAASEQAAVDREIVSSALHEVTPAGGEPAESS
jgi:hypothetical protein